MFESSVISYGSQTNILLWKQTTLKNANVTVDVVFTSFGLLISQGYVTKGSHYSPL